MPITRASPDLTVGRGLKRLVPALLVLERIVGIARPYGRARIETRCRLRRERFHHASPDLTVGRGLKQDRNPPEPTDPVGIARPYGRARIETSSSNTRSLKEKTASPDLTVGRGLKQRGKAVMSAVIKGIARPYGRARIETPTNPGGTLYTFASPDLTVGRGLKHLSIFLAEDGSEASPDLTVGRGLKPMTTARFRAVLRRQHRPTLRSGAD